jgi:hypothetical protein
MDVLQLARLVAAGCRIQWYLYRMLASCYWMLGSFLLGATFLGDGADLCFGVFFLAFLLCFFILVLESDFPLSESKYIRI